MESARFFRDGDRLYILHHGDSGSVRDLTLAAPASAAAGGSDGKVRAAMNGRVVAVLVKQGERVEAGQPVMTLEAMKMEHVHTAPVSGMISAIDVVEGEQVTTGKIVAEIEAKSLQRRASRAMTDNSSVVLEKRGQAFWITINRPEKRNAINGDVVAGIAQGYRDAHDDPEVRVIVLTGAGDKAFCAGADLSTPARPSRSISPSPMSIMPTCCGWRRMRQNLRSRASTASAWPAAWGCCA